MRLDTGRNEKIQRHERVCKQCNTGVEDEIHVLLYCPVLLAERQAHIRELREEVRTGQGDVTSLLTFLAGLNDATTIAEDREQAEKTMMLLMTKNKIWKTMAMAKKIMLRRAKFVRDREGESSLTCEVDEVQRPSKLLTGRPGTTEVRSRRRR